MANEDKSKEIFFYMDYGNLVELIAQGLIHTKQLESGYFRCSLWYEDPNENHEDGKYVLRVREIDTLREMGIDLPGKEEK